MTNFHTEPGGDVVAFDLGGGVRAEKIAVGDMDNNAYLLTPDGGPSVLIDAAADADRLIDWLADRPVSTIVTTHRHHDHVGALAALVKATGAEAVCGEPDRAAIARATGVHCRGVWDGDTIALGDAAGLAVIGLVGHTPGSVALASCPAGGPASLFTGDSLFPGGPGRTTNERDFRQLMDDLESKVFGRFDDDTVVHSGHGDATTLGAERPQLGEWRQRGW